DAVQELARRIADRHGGVDFVDSNATAAISPGVPYAEQVDDLIDTNNLGATRMIRSFGPLLRPGGRCPPRGRQREGDNRQDHGEETTVDQDISSRGCGAVSDRCLRTARPAACLLGSCVCGRLLALSQWSTENRGGLMSHWILRAMTAAVSVAVAV